MEIILLLGNLNCKFSEKTSGVTAEHKVNRYIWENKYNEN